CSRVISPPGATDSRRMYRVPLGGAWRTSSFCSRLTRVRVFIADPPPAQPDGRRFVRVGPASSRTSSRVLAARSGSRRRLAMILPSVAAAAIPLRASPGAKRCASPLAYPIHHLARRGSAAWAVVALCALDRGEVGLVTRHDRGLVERQG